MVSSRTMMKKSNKTAFEAALSLLARRAQSEWEMRTKLKRKEYTASEIEETVKRLLASRYINDAELAEEVFLYYREERLYGDRYIHQKLKARGLHSSCHLTREEEEEKAALALQNKEKIIPGFSENYRKAAAYLFRRGFSPGTVSAVMQERGEADPFFGE